MKIPCRYLLAVFIYLMPVSLPAQSVIQLTDTLVNKMLQAGDGPVIRFSFDSRYMYRWMRFESDISKKYIVGAVDYLVYKKGSAVSCRKIVEQFNEDASNYSLVASEIVPFADSLYQWLTSRISAIRHEQILPFEYFDLYEDTMLDMWSSHPVSFQIGIYTNREKFEKAFTDDYLDKWSYYYRNLNFEANTRTVLFSFFRKLEEYFLTNDNRFKFIKFD